MYSSMKFFFVKIRLIFDIENGFENQNFLLYLTFNTKTFLKPFFYVENQAKLLERFYGRFRRPLALLIHH